MRRLILLVLAGATLSASTATAACINKFTVRSDGPTQTVTFLTGKLTFQDAQALSAAIRERKSPPLEWLDASGKSLAKAVGELKVVRPMPVSCDNNPSGVVMISTFLNGMPPRKTMTVKLNSDTTVVFDEQSR